MMEKYETLIKTKDIYPPEFIERFGYTDPHWETENWARRERSLCHDMTCILLANSEPKENLELEIIQGLKRAREQIEYPEPKRPRLCPSPTNAEEEEESTESSWSDSDIEIMEDSDYAGEDEERFLDPKAAFENEYGEIFKYRYIVLEGLSAASQFQNHFCQKWGIERPRNMFDMIDTKEKRLIEVKVTIKPDEAMRRFLEKYGGLENYSLVVVDIENFQIDVYNKEDPFPGESKAINFLINRKAHQKTLGVLDKLEDEEPLETILIPSMKIDEYLSQTNEFIESTLNRSIPGPCITTGFQIEDITPEKLFSMLKDPLQIKAEKTVEWKGKITPFFYCDPTIPDDDRDEHAIDIFLVENFKDAKILEGKEELLNSIVELQKRWFEKSDKEKQFGFIDVANKEERASISSTLKNAFMIGAKRVVFGEYEEGMVQEERTPLAEHNYSKWYEQLYEDLGKEHEFVGYKTILCGPEEHSQIPLYNFLGRWVEEFFAKVSTKNVGLLMNQITNFYSRISGAYNTTIGNKATYSKIAAIPIKISLRGENKLRACSGICFRGPHHMKSATDKSNLLIIERLNPSYNIPKDFYSSATKIRCPGGNKYIIRKTAIKKIDGIHLTFIENSLFMATNMIGDTLFNHPEFKDEQSFRALCQAFIINESSQQFFIDRVIDAVLMAVIGNSRDEGFFNMFRKLMMFIINERRGEHSFTFDVGGMCNKLNECILDNPIGMNMLISFRYCLCKLVLGSE